MTNNIVQLWVKRLVLLAAISSGACAAPLQRATTANPASGAAPPPSARPAARSTAQSRRRIRRRQRPRHRARGRHPLAGGASHPDRRGGRHEHGRTGRRSVRHRDGRRELAAFITSVDWDALFGDSSFEYKNVRRKADARAYPSQLEFGLKDGRIVPPTALNNGQSVELMLARITAPYFDIEDFDELPTPFRTVAVDLLSAEPVVMRSGSLADALRATMSLPLAFPPVDVDGRMLVDGGAMNNVPADVVRAMGAGRVVAINVGDLSTPRRHQRHDVRPGQRNDGCDDAGVDQARADVSRHRRERSAEGVRIAGLAARRQSDRGRLPRRRGDARSAAAAGRLAGGVRSVAGRPPGEAANGAAGPHLRPARWIRAERRDTAGGAARETRRRAGEHRRRRARHRHHRRPRPLSVRDVADDARSRARRRPSRAGPRQAVRAAISDARRHAGEHDVERLPDHRIRTVSRLRSRRVGLGAAHRRHDRLGREPGRPSCTCRSRRRRCSLRHMPASRRRHSI